MKYHWNPTRRRNVGDEKWKEHAFALKPSRKAALIHSQPSVLSLKANVFEDHCGIHIKKKLESHTCLRNLKFLPKVQNQPQESYFANGMTYDCIHKPYCMSKEIGDEAHVNVVTKQDNQEVVGPSDSKGKFFDQRKEYVVLESFSKTIKIHYNEIAKSKTQQSMKKEMSYEARDKFVGVARRSTINTSDSDLKPLGEEKGTIADNGLKRNFLHETNEQSSSKSPSAFSSHRAKKIKGNDHDFTMQYSSKLNLMGDGNTTYSKEVDGHVIQKLQGREHVLLFDVDDKARVAKKVNEILCLIRMARKLVLHNKSKYQNCQEGHHSKRIDQLTSQIVKRNISYKVGPYIGSFPGIEVGVVFRDRMELSIIGFHNPSQGGIDYMQENGKTFATSIVATSWRGVDKDYSNVLEYLGEGGNPTSKDKNFTDQKLERGNLSLKNSYEDEREVRVIRGFRERIRSKLETIYVYDGLYLVKGYSKEKGRHGTYVFKFQLERIPGQPQLSLKKFNL
ncbi:Histone-lysine N-methyltransferase, H3 lysine-9 specific SUVH6 [Thalictrum thalictroides]|uniref:Histone-lysine N-methyltransferase, H3 lysine-9 specific SUVH6 n=1 Tax=Thalictrum thalictroides TaxID=46969 RepID=A0A7J6VZ76_THATH|nr:Histone-lysine N-methyltransferase, H3 lysine-9 specific SUVH6 [Thalictrum thalictroides]